MNSFAILQALIFEPRKAFAELAERPRILFPMALLIIGMGGLMYWYNQVVDLQWVTDRQMRSGLLAGMFTDQQIEERVKTAGDHPGVTGAFAVFAQALGLVIGFALVSLYYLLAGKVTNIQRGYRQWFSFCCWTNLPTLLTVVTGAVVLLTATTGQIEETDLRALSLNSLFFHKAAGEPGRLALAYIGLPELLTIYLSILGVRIWSGRSWLFSAIFTLLPTAIIVGCVLLFTMGRS